MKILRISEWNLRMRQADSDFLFFWVRPTLDMYDRFLWKTPYQCFSPDAEKHRDPCQCHFWDIEMCRLISARCASINSYLKKASRFENCDRKLDI